MRSRFSKPKNPSAAALSSGRIITFWDVSAISGQTPAACERCRAVATSSRRRLAINCIGSELSSLTKRVALQATRVGRVVAKAKPKQPPANHRNAFVACLCAVAIYSAFAHWPVLSAQAHCFDDNEFVTENPLVQNPSLASAGRFVGEVLEPSTVHGYYAPLTMISLMFDYGLGGRPDDLRQFHRTNLLLHILNAMLVFALLYRLTNALVPALLAAILFAGHPLSVEPVAWLAERKTLLAAFFSLAALQLYVQGTRADQPRLRHAALVAFALGCLAKPTAVVVPALMLTLDYWPLGRLDRKTVTEKIPFFALATIFATITLVSHQRTVGIDAPAGGIIESVLTAFHLIAFYLGKVVWPVELTPVYLLPDPMSVANPTIALSLGVSIALGVASLWFAKRGVRAPLVGLLFVVLALSPTLGGLRYSWVVASDKYMYLPAVGLALVAAWLFDLAWRRAGAWRVGTTLVALTLIAIETTTARAQLNQWRNTETLYNHMIHYTPDVSILHANLGEVHWQRGRVEAAHQSLTRALKLDPHNANAHNNLGVLFWTTQRPQEAFKHLSLAVAADPNLSQPHRNLGIALNGIGRFAEAANEFELSLVINPGDPQTQCGYALSLAETGRIAKAREHYAESIRLQPGCVLPPGALQ